MAQFLGAARRRGRHPRGSRLAERPHRSALRRLRWPPRACLSGRSSSDRASLLHERRRIALRGSRMTGRRAGVAALIAAGAVFALALQYAAAPRAITAAAPQSAARADLKVATFAAGCFWCTEADFDGLSGVVATTAGYTGGRKANPSYAQVSSGGTGHVESVQVL